MKMCPERKLALKLLRELRDNLKRLLGPQPMVYAASAGVNAPERTLDEFERLIREHKCRVVKGK